MGPRTDILDQPESLRNPLFGSVALHIGVAAAFIFFGARLQESRFTLGSPSPMGGSAVAISTVKSIPLPPKQGPVNPVANDTESVVPPAPKAPQTARRVKTPSPDAIPLKSREKPLKPRPETSVQNYRPNVTYRPNQIYSAQAPAAVSPMFARQGAGTVGVDQNSVLGSRFGAYARLLMDRVAQHWSTSGLQGVRAPFAIVAVDLNRDGSIRNPHLVQSSGNYQIDTSAVRAIADAAPFPPLPDEYGGNVLNVEFRFQIQP